MLDFEETIDLDALFDTLNLVVAQSGAPQAASVTPSSSIETPEVQELSTLGVDLFLFDSPADQS